MLVMISVAQVTLCGKFMLILTIHIAIIECVNFLPPLCVLDLFACVSIFWHCTYVNIVLL